MASNVSEQHGAIIFGVKQTFCSTLKKETACSSNLPKYTATHPMKQSFSQPLSLSLEAAHLIKLIKCQTFSSPTNALVEFIKTRLKLRRLLQHVSVYKETIIREPVSA